MEHFVFRGLNDKQLTAGIPTENMLLVCIITSFCVLIFDSVKWLIPIGSVSYGLSYFLYQFDRYAFLIFIAYLRKFGLLRKDKRVAGYIHA